MSGFMADLDELVGLVERLEAFGAELVEQVGDLDAAAARLAGFWVGAAAEQHADSHARWSRGARDMAAGLDGMRRCVATAHENYRAAVSSNLAMWP